MKVSIQICSHCLWNLWNTLFFMFFKTLFVYWQHCITFGIPVPPPGIKPVPPTLETRSLNHWTTREVPVKYFIAEQAKNILKYLRLFKGRRRISDQGLLVSKWKKDSGMKLVFYCRLSMAPHSSTLAWKTPWTEEPGRLQSLESLRVGHDWATSLSLFTFMHWRRKWQPTPVFLPGESQG